MTIIERLNSLREERRNLLNEANSCDSMDRLAEIHARLNALNSEIETVESIRDQMGAAAEPVRTNEQAVNREATFGEQLQRVAVAGYERTGRRLSGVTLRENLTQNGGASGQNETVLEDGGILLSPTVTTSLLKGVREQSFFLPRVRKLAVGPNSNSVEMPYWPNADRSDENRYGGAKAYWLNEAEKYTPSKTQFATRSIKLAKLGALGYATEEMLRDSTYLESIMTDAFISAMVWEVDESIVSGAGMVEGETARPLGFLNEANKALVAVEMADEVITAADIMAMYNRMPAEERSRAIWLVNPDVEAQLMLMTMQTGSASGQLVYMPPNGLSAQPYGTLFGRPVVPNEHMPAIGEDGAIAFVNPGEYFWIERDGLRRATSVHVRFEYDEMAFKFTWRCNGVPSRYAADIPAKGSTARSSYVMLKPMRDE